MATMVARGSSPLSSSISIQEKGRRNKRKFRADPPITDPITANPPLQTECSSYDELFPVERNSDDPSLEHHVGACSTCGALMCGPLEGLGLDEFQDTDWTQLTETQLEEILLSNLDTIFKSAIKIITSSGYSEEVATSVVLRSGLCYGCKDTISNIADNALAFLRSGQEVESSRTENSSEDLQKLAKTVLADMISVLREVRPFFSTGDAMWCLLICDMNISHACALDENPLSSIGNGEISGNSASPRVESSSNSNNISAPTTPELNAPGPEKLKTVLPYPENTSPLEMSTVVGIPNLPYGRFLASSNVHDMVPNLSTEKENPISSSRHMEESSSSTISQSLQEGKPIGSRRVHLGSSKREFILRQKSIHFEKSYRALGSKAAFRACKQSGLGGLILDRKSKPISNSKIINMKSTSIKVGKAMGIDKSKADATLELSFTAGLCSSASCSTKTVSSPSPTPSANTELSLSLPSASSSGAGLKPDCSIEASNCCNLAGIPSDKISTDWVPQDKKDDMLVKLVPRLRELQAQLQDWTDWAQQKVMQAARRLSKDKLELQTLRQEKEDVVRLQKERRNLEDNTRKKLGEMEIAISKANDQVERASASARRLDVENARLRLEMEAAKLQAAEAAASCHEVTGREIKSNKMFQSWERQKSLSQEELVSVKQKLSLLQRQLEQAKEHQDQLEARRRQEEKMKDEALSLSNSERTKQEKFESSAKSQENALILKEENDLQKYKMEIRRLEQQTEQLRLMTDSSKFATLKWGTNKSYVSCLSDGRKNSNANYLTKIISQYLGSDDIQPERECVMCLTEEMSIVFLPCAHQVVCTKCNELHEKQGMKDCPSCRTPIQRRISVRSADS
ncbi:putative E3 ubiquitin-protein ligase RF298 [Phoenix dactylifera]|uniref:E3 ubiquitin-protein ligase RF298 n=1 Tax=Phoenix dactylifera TaxID=42345 RepID=A0A8B7BJG2_PHODC|nr:putative E3 ubiquitin-protein ligase RF298 [Phoenix dactylifera]XP_008778410.2 putative E3 ubiquitin-protein ligase RF298 [Phoenix dactylifera]XP_008778411.2 putative E3 ubiquitin-protein ligase RF298 [Phoenix dactylifera]XP_017696328.2 putative E3 ubiquitin-protein ligase RF298 [Phoenix dactylifera]XP_017696329.2 putative E3 ubiquitin-protein ligase RF298 [Phoenix dactylifera]XP_026657328.2 putative E3 ubiquitin-protein ligase RF298 [Phoenix dactylifera]